MKYKKTVLACYMGYVIQAIVNNYAALLLVTFQKEYLLSMTEMTLLITVNFVVQLLMDLASAFFIDKIGYRASAVLAHIAAAAGLGGLTFFPALTADAFTGLLAAVICYAAGGGLLEVLISPIIEALPLENKEKHMSLLHSFYCWGHMAVVLLSTILFAVFGIQQWRILTWLWALLSALNIILFMDCPIFHLISKGEKGDSLSSLFHKPVFWLLILMMVCSGASNNGISQWLSAFLEGTLAVPKNVGDITGTMAYAMLMGLSRVMYAKCSEKIELKKAILYSSLGCVMAYLLISIPQAPLLNILGCSLCGFSVGLLWPGTFSIASSAMRQGGTLLFALLALAGDIGCAAGPGLVGAVTGRYGGDMKLGILAGSLFPILMLLCILYGNIKKIWKVRKENEI
ncbi:MFS transporter [Murimonas intestini]|uniref:MFS transporter n=1 Tax=Murimonas intestini TaxID=1337051 RepID=UPI0011DD4AD8|nr:MFS transporter [Murimonas intestini]